MPERRPHLPAFKTRPRCCTSIAGLIYAVGGLNSAGTLQWKDHQGLGGMLESPPVEAWSSFSSSMQHFDPCSETLGVVVPIV